ncbi:MAG: maltose ABC transporter substrate-binding protein [Candidatus Eremiobacteraeota bacterium]|nr:maltose ABC transporter substrate-binding protein [Candidatus Eremiobacteraeota bacterium]
MASRARLLTVLLFLIALLPSCGGPPKEKKELIIWTDMTETVALRNAASRFTGKTGFPVRIVRVPFEELQPKFQVAAPVRHGPDLITGPHNWIGPFATAGLIAPIEIGPDEEKGYLPVALRVMSFKGRLYGLPLSLETLGLIYNKRFIKSPPRTFQELITVADHINKGTTGELRTVGNFSSMLNFDAFTGEKMSGFLYEIEDFYFSWSFIGGYGAYIFKETPGGLDPLDVGISCPEAVEATKFILDLKKKYQIIPQGVTKDIANARFLENRLAMTINGPWALVDFRKKVEFGFAPIPQLENGKAPSPLVGVQGVMLNSKSFHKDLALQLMKEITSSEGQVEIYLEGGRIPSRFDAQKDSRISEKAILRGSPGEQPGGPALVFSLASVKNDEVKGIIDAAAVGTPMPNIPEFTAVWQPMKEALQLIVMEKIPPEEALTQAKNRIEQDIRRMMR